LTPEFKLVRHKRFSEYPSGSAITYWNKVFFITGDDSTDILKLDEVLNVMGSVTVEKYAAKRIPKPIKPDYEASALIHTSIGDKLLLLGSAATEIRKKISLVSLEDNNKVIHLNSEVFSRRLRKLGIRELNLEGITLVGSEFLLANRGNLGYPENHLIVTGPEFWNNQSSVSMRLIHPDLKKITQEFTGISDIYYLPEADVLFMCTTSEATSNVYDDGAIGKSYIVWINNFQSKLSQDSCLPDGWLDLQSLDKIFVGQKIEGLCVQKVNSKTVHIQLVSDNDSGDTGWFELEAIGFDLS
jgi:hypothetical protein